MYEPYDEGDILGRIPSLLPEHERAEAKQLVESVGSLRGFVKCFEFAVELFDYCETEFNNISHDYEILRPEDLGKTGLRLMNAQYRMMGWMRIACRDGALQLFHFARIMQVIRETLYRCPGLLQQTDVDQLRLAMRLVKKQFPHWELIRHSVAHSPQEFMPSVASRIAQGLGPFNLGEMIYGRQYILTKEGVRYDYVIDRDSLRRLEWIRTEFLKGFADLMERGKSADLWPHVAQPPQGQSDRQS